jgi:RNA polymerase sigma-70 factor (ECF subfamily)
VPVDDLVEKVSDGDPGVDVESAEQSERIKKTLDLLAPKQRMCLKLFYLEGWTCDEIVEGTGFTSREIKTHVQNGKRRFRHLWQRVE